MFTIMLQETQFVTTTAGSCTPLHASLLPAAAPQALHWINKLQDFWCSQLFLRVQTLQDIKLSLGSGTW
jgi:hypothetical protein